ncbi:MAG TPA: DUF3467 domain-containing protein [Fodinibius sp.]|nr:DUF3467 domain-containing protein [Fodinibius sp.]
MPDQTQNMNQGQVEIELPEEEASGTYSNLVMISHSPSEFILDFISVMPGRPKAKVEKRMVLSPDHAKRLLNALSENIDRFEKENGAISDGDKIDVPFNYRGPTPEA